MYYSIYILSIFIAALFGWASFIIVLTKLSPYESAALALTFFYVSLFTALTATFGLIGYYIRVWIYNNEIYFSHITTSLRQGALLSSMTCVAFVFQRMRVLTWWDGLLLLTLIIFIEFYFMMKES